MLDFRLTILLVAVIGIIAIGLLLVLNKRISRQVRQSFVLTCFGLVWWQVFLYLSDTTSANTLLFNRLLFAGPAVSIFGIYWLTNALSDKNLVSRRASSINALIVLLSPIVLSLTPYIVNSILPRVNDMGQIEGYDLDRGVGYLPYVLAIFGSMIIVVGNIVGTLRGKSDQKHSLKYLVYAILGALLLGVITNVALPLILGTSSVSSLGILSTIFFVSVTSYGIARRGLFDIRAVVARYLGYLISLTFLTIIVSAVTVVVTGMFLRIDLDIAEQVAIVALIIVTAAALQPIKRYFDRFTNRYFFRELYSTQEFINEFNQLLISTIDLEELLHDSSNIIKKYINPEFSLFALREHEGDYLRCLNFDDLEYGEESIEQARAYLKTSKKKVISLQKDIERHSDLYDILDKQDIEAIVRITSELSLEGIGYLFLGVKKSGGSYTGQDIKALEILANELVVAIQNSLQYEEIQKFNITLQDKINDATKELKHSNEKLKQLDEAKDEFISMASHQLRTPLTSIKGYLSMVIEGDAGKVPQKQREMLESAFTSSQRMVYLIADLLNVSRLKTGKFLIETKEVDLTEVVQGEVDQLQETAKSRRLSINYSKPKTFPKVILDETKIRQVVMNFLDNAIYYTPAGGEINVVLEHDANSVSYKVIDNGIGVPKSEQHKLFAKFYRAGNARKARPDGTGLGIFMAQKIIVAQEGSIIFSSEEGKGSTFGFTFPRDKVGVKQGPEEKETPKKAVKPKKSSSPKSRSKKK